MFKIECQKNSEGRKSFKVSADLTLGQLTALYEALSLNAKLQSDRPMVRCMEHEIERAIAMALNPKDLTVVLVAQPGHDPQLADMLDLEAVR